MDNLDILQALYNIIISMIQRNKVEYRDEGCFLFKRNKKKANNRH